MEKLGWGGARAGAGRKKGSKAAETMSAVFVRLPREMLAEIDRLAAESNMNRSDYIRAELAEALKKK